MGIAVERLDFAPFIGVSADDLLPLAEAMRELHVPAGETIVHEGTPATGARVLLSGTILREDPTLATLNASPSESAEAGTWFSRGALLLPLSHRHRFTALSDCAVLLLERTAFEALLERGAPAAYVLLDFLLDQMGDEIRDLNQAINRLLLDGA
jgi:CRP-like cAMP-binding protein